MERLKKASDLLREHVRPDSHVLVVAPGPPMYDHTLPTVCQIVKKGGVMAMDNRVSVHSRTEVKGGIGGIKDWEKHFDGIMDAWGIKDAKRPEFRLGDANKPPLGDKKFDVIAEHMSLGFINLLEQTKPLEALLEHLKPRGKFISTMSGNYDIKEIEEFLRKRGFEVRRVSMSDMYELETSKKPDHGKIGELIGKMGSRQVSSSAIPRMQFDDKILLVPANIGSQMLIAEKKA